MLHSFNIEFMWDLSWPLPCHHVTTRVLRQNFPQENVGCDFLCVVGFGLCLPPTFAPFGEWALWLRPERTHLYRLTKLLVSTCILHYKLYPVNSYSRPSISMHRLTRHDLIPSFGNVVYHMPQFQYCTFNSVQFYIAAKQCKIVLRVLAKSQSLAV